MDALARRLGMRRPIRGGGGVRLSLESRIQSVLLGGAWVAPLLYLARADTIDAASVGTWRNLGSLGSAGNATQATPANKPTFNATVLSSRPALSFDGGDMLTTPNVNLSAYTAVAVIALFQDNDAANSHVCEFTTDVVTINGGFVLAVNNGAAGDLMFGHGTVLGFCRSAASFTMTDPAVVTGTGNRALATNETQIRHNKIDVTSTRPANTDTAGGYAAAAALHIGARTGVVNSLIGDLAALIVACGTTAPPLTQIATVEQMLKSEWGLP